MKFRLWDENMGRLISLPFFQKSFCQLMVRKLKA